jgi:hypothetical protein
LAAAGKAKRRQPGITALGLQAMQAEQGRGLPDGLGDAGPQPPGIPGLVDFDPVMDHQLQEFFPGVGKEFAGTFGLARVIPAVDIETFHGGAPDDAARRDGRAEIIRLAAPGIMRSSRHLLEILM